MFRRFFLPPLINSFWKNFLLLQLLILFYFLAQSCAAAEEDQHDFFRHEIRYPQFQVVAEKTIDRFDFYSHTLSQMDDFRGSIAHIAGRTGITPESKKLNIACFAFEIFNAEGNPILFPFFFGHPNANSGDDVGEEAASGGGDGEERASLLRYPHFFISGRLDRTKIENGAIEGENISIVEGRNIGRDDLTYLPDPPTSLFYEYRRKYEETWKIYQKLAPFLLPPPELARVRDHKNALKQAFQIENLECRWVHHCDARRKGRNFAEEQPQRVKNLLRMKTEPLRREEDGRVIKIIKSRKEDKRLSDEDIFQHSEQLALARINDELEGFIRFVRNFMSSRDINMSNIHSVVLHVFSRNTLCARCSSSIVLDFTRNFRSKLLQTLFDENRNIPVYIIAPTRVPCATKARESEKLPDRLYKKIHDHPPTEEISLGLYAGPKDGSRIYQWVDLNFHGRMWKKNHLDLERFPISFFLARDFHEWTPLHVLAQIDDIEFTRGVIQRVKREKTYFYDRWWDAFLTKNTDDDTSLHVAVNHDNQNFLRFLLEEGFPWWIFSYVRGSHDNTLLHTAAAKSKEGTIRFLLSLYTDRGETFDLATTTSGGHTPSVVAHGRPEDITSLLRTT